MDEHRQELARQLRLQFSNPEMLHPDGSLKKEYFSAKLQFTKALEKQNIPYTSKELRMKDSQKINDAAPYGDHTKAEIIPAHDKD